MVPLGAALLKSKHTGDRFLVPAEKFRVDRDRGVWVQVLKERP